MNYAAEIERVAAETRRRSALLRAELADIHRRTEETAHRLAEESAADMARFFEDRADDYAEAVAQAQAREREEAEARAERERLEEHSREQRAAIARSIAARRANDIVTPIDEDDDPEGAYYRRKSWLI
ncbi:hypothetical protein [Nocardia arizonensis]|uniref:hypothetical protein n=1 Tax=Nocardia arizonensis TaxID=1141647 RepID=UPI0006D11A95|nr:hypothetical protein [Nocardia arizonensis]